LSLFSSSVYNKYKSRVIFDLLHGTFRGDGILNDGVLMKRIFLGKGFSRVFRVSGECLSSRTTESNIVVNFFLNFTAFAFLDDFLDG